MENNKTAGGQRNYPLSAIYFYLTNGCNQRCRHCWITPKFNASGVTYEVLDFGLFRSIIKEAKPLGLQSVKFTGGEPLLHPSIGEMIEFVSDEGLVLRIETNGMLCTDDIARRISNCKGAFVSISLDGEDSTTHDRIRGVPGAFDAALEGAGRLIASGVKVQLIMTLMRCNEHQIEGVVRLAETIGAGSLKFNVLQPTERGAKMHESKETLPVERLISLGQLVTETLSKKARLKLYFDHPMAFRPLKMMLGESGSACGVCGIQGIIGVLADGSYSMCGIGESVPELLYGKAGKDSLERVWEDTPAIKEIRSGLHRRLEGVCGECLHASRCLGGCIAQNFYRKKSLCAPFWYCEEARRIKVFPETRLRSSYASTGTDGH